VARNKVRRVPWIQRLISTCHSTDHPSSADPFSLEAAKSPGSKRKKKKCVVKKKERRESRGLMAITVYVSSVHSSELLARYSKIGVNAIPALSQQIGSFDGEVERDGLRAPIGPCVLQQ
jgi:hypothetical protein